MTYLTPDDVSDDDLAALADFIETLPKGELRDCIAYIHDCLARGNAVAIGAIEAKP